MNTRAELAGTTALDLASWENETKEHHPHSRIASYVVFVGIDTEGVERILLCKPRGLTMWALPGGGLREGEHPLQAAERESKEELWLEQDEETLQLPDEELLKQVPSNVGFFHVYTGPMPNFVELLHPDEQNPDKEPSKQKSHVFAAYVEAERFHPKPTKEMEDFRWVTKAELEDLYRNHNRQHGEQHMMQEVYDMAMLVFNRDYLQNNSSDMVFPDHPFARVRSNHIDAIRFSPRHSEEIPKAA